MSIVIILYLPYFSKQSPTPRRRCGVDSVRSFYRWPRLTWILGRGRGWLTRFGLFASRPLFLSDWVFLSGTISTGILARRGRELAKLIKSVISFAGTSVAFINSLRDAKSRLPSSVIRTLIFSIAPPIVSRIISSPLKGYLLRYSDQA